MGRLRFFSFSGAAARCADRAFCFWPANESPARVRGACVLLIVDNNVAPWAIFICVGRFSSESKAFADATSAGRRFLSVRLHFGEVRRFGCGAPFRRFAMI